MYAQGVYKIFTVIGGGGAWPLLVPPGSAVVYIAVFLEAYARTLILYYKTKRCHSFIYRPHRYSFM
jgi:hypothetical protein